MVLHKVIQAQQISQLELLLKEASEAFEENISAIRNFFLLDRQAKKTPLIEAVKVQNKEIINRLFVFAVEELPFTSIEVRDFLVQQDAEGYTALMRAVELNYQEGFDYFLNALLNSYWMITGEYEVKPILEVLRLKQRPIEVYGSRSSSVQERLTVIQLAAKMSNWKMLEELIDVVELVCGGKFPLTKSEVDYIGDNAINTLTRLFREERDSRLLQNTGRRMSMLERKQRQRRLKLARRLSQLGQRPSERNLVPEWVAMEQQNTVNRVINFFSIFCRSGASSQRKKRSIGNQCFFADEDYKISIPEEPLQLYKEALINILAVIKQKNLDSIEQVGIIRNTELPSDREKKVLENFSQVVTRYYHSYAATILPGLKENVATTLEAAFSEKKAYILVDSQKDLLLIKNNAIFSGSLLNPIKFFYLDPTLTPAALKLWLDTYFSSRYSLHPFNPELVQSYPDVLTDLKPAIISDAALSMLPYEHVQRKILRELFLLDGKPIELSKLVDKNFFVIYKARVSFRAERFHEIFFKLKIADQHFLTRFIATYKFPAATYPQLSHAENEYLTLYGNQLTNLCLNAEKITPVKLLEAAIGAHEKTFLRETNLLAEKKMK